MKGYLDKGWAWVITGAAFCTMFLTLGVVRASGILYIAIMNVYGANREEASWPYFLRKTVALYCGPLIAFLAEFVSIRSLIYCGVMFTFVGTALCFFAENVLFITISFGILFGIGTGFLFTANTIIVNRSFSKYRTIAMGLMLTGPSLSSFVFPPLTEYFVEKYGLSGTYLLLSGILMQGVIAASLYISPLATGNPTEPVVKTISKDAIEKADIKGQKYVGNHMSKIYKLFEFLKNLLKIMCMPMLYLIAFSFACLDSSYFSFLQIIVDHALDLGIPSHKAVFLLSASSFAELVGRIGGGWMVDSECIRRRNFLVICYLMQAAIYGVMPSLTTYFGLVVCAILLGLFSSCVVVNYAASYVEYLGLNNLPLSLGLGRIIVATVCVASPKLIGFFRDVMHKYEFLFYFYGSVCLFGSILWLLEPIVFKLQGKRFNEGKEIISTYL